MKAFEILDTICAGITVGEQTCDTVKVGDVQKEVQKVAVTMVPTLAVLREVVTWGADLLIVHEPLFYHHMDVVDDAADPVIAAKQAVLMECDMVVFRYHDYPHAMCPDLIVEGALDALGLTGELHSGNIFHADTPLTARQLADRFGKLGLAHIRMVGTADQPMTRFAMLLGSPGSLMGEYLRNPQVELVCVGETCEWRFAEYVRDAAAAGQKKAMLLLGHAGSERYGMEKLATSLAETYPGLAVQYFDCGEVYV